MTERYLLGVEYEVVGQPPAAILHALREELAHYDATADFRAGVLTVRLALSADSPVDAARGVDFVQVSVLKHGPLRPMRMIGYDVVAEDRAGRRRDAEQHSPELAGLAEVAQITGYSKGRVSQLREDLSPYLLQELASGPVYRAAGVRRFAAENPKSTPGVRRSEIDLTPLERSLLEALAAAAAGVEAPAPAAGHRIVADAIEGVLGQGRQVLLHAQPEGSELAAAFGSLLMHGLVRTRMIYQKERAAMGAGHEEDLVVSLTSKGERHSGIRPQPGAGTEGQEDPQ
ncbi:hypothetical protein [Streptomyces sp. MMBL 11-1]|uniref:hypothetical protein n=1 Tax=Streptomyces sp. MMBL 11-1 TaxID=3026420 RepID=UPI00235F61BB|nr:hypothetical protein [Streptomyces sp. MMBL 11-1]